MTPLISARGLSKAYGDKLALRPTDLDIPAGRILGVIGANGAGKSTLLNCLLGLCDYEGELSVLGLDIMNRRAFYDAVLTEYFDETRSIIITTHQIDEIEPILTHAMFIRDGAVKIDTSMEAVAARYRAVDVPEQRWAEAEALGPIYSRRLLGRISCVFDGADPERLAALGEPRRVGLSDLFVALSE